MRKGVFALSALSCAALAAGALAAAAPTAAKAAARQQQEEELTVEAPRPTQDVVGRTYTGAKVVAYSLSRYVSYADLDLRRYAGVTALRRRIRATAKDACEDLAQDYPLLQVSEPQCVRQAVSGAMTRAQAAIAAAQQ